MCSHSLDVELLHLKSLATYIQVQVASCSLVATRRDHKTVRSHTSDPTHARPHDAMRGDALHNSTPQATWKEGSGSKAKHSAARTTSCGMSRLTSHMASSWAPLSLSRRIHSHAGSAVHYPHYLALVPHSCRPAVVSSPVLSQDSSPRCPA